MDGNLGLAGYQVYRHEVDEQAKTLKFLGAAQAGPPGLGV
jgi:hypothetical protein